MGQRYRQYNPHDDPAQTDGDLFFTGVRTKGEPDQYTAGLVHAATNMSFDGRIAKTRKGSRTPASFLNAALVGPVFGAGIFSDPNELEWQLLATAAGVWRMRDGCTSRLVATPTPITGRVEFVQTFGTMLLFFGTAAPGNATPPEPPIPWSWDGNVTHPFAQIDQSVDGDGTIPIPNGTTRPGLRPVCLNSRLFVPHDRNFLGASDVLDFTRFDEALMDFYVGGSDDHLFVQLFPYQGSNIIVFLDQSIQLFSGLTGDLSASALSSINDSLGCCAAGTVAMLGSDILFLSTTGVYRLTQVVQQLIQTAPLPVSEPIEQLLDVETGRVNWQAIAGASAAVYGRYYFLALPIDGSGVNNAIFVYDTVGDAWHGVHTWPAGVQFDKLQISDYQGAKRLYGIDYANARVHLLYEGKQDVIGSTVYPIPSSVETRRYGFGPATANLGAPAFDNGAMVGQKRMLRGRVVVRGWNPAYSLSQKAEGTNETVPLRAGVTEDRTKYKQHAAPAYDPSNAGDNHGAPGREDYSIDIGTPFDPGTNGVDPDLEQTHSEPVALRTQKRGVGMIIANSTGTLSVLALDLEGAIANRAGRPR